MARPQKTDAEIQAVRERILDTALAILQESGPEALTSRAIARRLNVAHMYLFTYFKNKAAILAAPEGLDRILNNLVSNAVRYTTPGGTIRLAWRVEPDGTGVFAVTDSGIGIAADEI